MDEVSPTARALLTLELIQGSPGITAARLPGNGGATEALGLVMAVLDGHHDAGDPTDPVGSALGKIIRALPEAVAAQAEAVRRTTAPAPDRAAARPDPTTTTTLVQACSDRRPIRLGYRSEA